MEDVQDLCQMEMPEEKEEHSEEKGDEQHGERSLSVNRGYSCSCDCRPEKFNFPVFNLLGEDTSHGQEERPSTPTHLATTVF